MVKIIYLSFAQGQNINGSLLAKNVSAVMIRAGQGNWEDPLFRYNYKLCIDNKIPFGIWWFCQPDMKAEYQIDAFMKVWNSLEVKPSVIAYDVEEIDYLGSDGKMKKLFPPSRQFNHDNVLKWCKEIARLTGANVGIYTRKNYFEDWTFETNEWYDFWLWIAAWYVYSGVVEPALPWKWTTFAIHQYEGGGLGTPGVDPSQTCKERFNGTLEQCLKFFGSVISNPVGEKTMIYDTSIKQADRAPILFLCAATDKHPNMPAIKIGGTAGVMIKFGGMDGDTREMSTMLYTDTEYFQTNLTRAKAAGLPVLAYWDLRGGGYHLEKQHDQGPLENEHWWESQIFTTMLTALRVNGSWSRQMLASDNGWMPFNAIVLGLWDTNSKGGFVPDIWQKITLDTVLKHLLLLRGNGQFPNVPIIIQSWPDFLQMYPDYLGNYLNNVKQEVTVALSQLVFSPTPGPQLPNIATLFSTYRPTDSFIYTYLDKSGVSRSFTPLGYDAVGDNSFVSMHNLSWGRFTIPEVTDNAGKNQFADYFLFCKDLEGFNKFLNYAGDVNPTPDPTPTETLQKKLENNLAEFKTRKPGDGSVADRFFAIAITELEKLIAFTGFYLNGK